MRSTLVALLVCSGCSIGAGPNAGYGLKHGWFGGVEAKAGFAVPEAVVGFQSSGASIYGRLDIDLDPIDDPPPLGARFGGGLGTALARENGAFYMFSGGPAIAHSFSHHESGASDVCSNIYRGPHDDGFEITLQLRHTDEWQILLSGHLECVRTSSKMQ